MDTKGQTEGTTTGAAHRPHMSLSSKGLLVLLLVVVLPWIFLVRLTPRPVSDVGSSIRSISSSNGLQTVVSPNGIVLMQPCRPGPWGRIDLARINLEPPEEFIPKGWENTQTTTWHFVGMDATAVAGVFDSAGLPDPIRAALLDRNGWHSTPEGIAVFPSDAILTALEPGARERIYAVLGRFKENVTQATPYCFKPDLLEERFADSNLTPERIAVIRKMMYPRGSLLLFSDMFAALNTTADLDEKMQMIKTISRMRTMILRLHLNEDTDVKALVDYWGKGGRAKDLRPLLESLARVPGGFEIDVVHLLPRFARLRLYTFPLPSDAAGEANEDCHWSSFNFFEEPPNPDYTRPDLVAQVLEQEYFKLPGSPEFGDIVFIMLPSGDVIHSAVYLADDVVFTKNGPSSEQPWMLMTIPDLMALYTATRAPNELLSVVYWRRKDF